MSPIIILYIISITVIVISMTYVVYTICRTRSTFIGNIEGFLLVNGCSGGFMDNRISESHL